MEPGQKPRSGLRVRADSRISNQDSRVLRTDRMAYALDLDLEGAHSLRVIVQLIHQAVGIRLSRNVHALSQLAAIGLQERKIAGRGLLQRDQEVLRVVRRDTGRVAKQFDLVEQLAAQI